MIPSFGKDGIVDLKVGVGHRQRAADRSRDRRDRPPLDADRRQGRRHRRLVVPEGVTVKTHNNTKGLVRAFDVRTGKLLWTFNTIPRPGEFGNDTWENDSWAINGNTGVWTQITRRRRARPRLPAGRDADLGLLRRPSSGQQPVRREPRLRRSEDRPAQVALPARASSDLELRHVVGADPRSTSPSTASAIKAVAVPSKQAFLYVFDRVTGQPVWPIEERPVPQSDVPGEKTSPTQPFPTKPPAYARNYVKVPDDLIDFTPELRAQALEALEALQDRADRVQRRRSSATSTALLGAHRRSATATNWPGGGYDPETHIALRAGRQHRRRRAIARRSRRRDSPTSGTCRASAGQPFREVLGPGDCCAADAPRTPSARASAGDAAAGRRRPAPPPRRRRPAAAA